MCVCVCESVCVETEGGKEREKWGEREREIVFLDLSIHTMIF